MSTAVMRTKPAARSFVVWCILPSAALAAVLWLTGVSPITALALAAVVAWQGVGGFLAWRHIRPQSSPLELFGMGIAVGTAAAAIAGILTSTLGWGAWGSLVPTAVVLPLGLWTGRQRTATGASNRIEVSAFVSTSLAGLAIVLYAIRNYPLTWIGSWTGYHPDMAFFEALANSLARLGAFESPFMSGATVRYHWLSYAWTGQLSVITDAAPFVGITRVLPLVSLLGSAAIVVSWTRRLSSNNWTPFLAGGLLTVSGFVGAVFGGVLTVDSPSQAMSVLWLLAFVLAVTRAFNANLRPSVVTLLVLLSVAITLGKVSAAAPGLAAVLLTSVVLAAHRSIPVPRASTVVAATALPIGLTFLLFLAGSSGGGGLDLGSLIDRASSQQGLNPVDGTRGVLLGTAILIMAVLPRWAGVLALVVEPTWRWRPETWISLGLIASSVGALVLFNSFNEIWFSASVSGPLATTSAVGAGIALNSLQTQGKPRTGILLAVIGIAAGILFVLVWWAWSSGASGGNLFVGTLRWLGPILAWAGAIAVGVGVAFWVGKPRFLPAVVAGIVLTSVFVALPGRLLGVGSSQIGALQNGIRNEWFNVSKEGRVVTLDQSEANDWTSPNMEAAAALRAEAQPRDLIATNVTRSPFVAGVTHLPTYVSGMVYQYDYGPPDMQEELTARERQVWEFIDNPGSLTALPLCDANVRWLWVDLHRTPERDWEPYATNRLELGNTIIAEMNRDYCA